MSDTETAQSTTFREAFDSAVEQHSPHGDGQATTAKESPAKTAEGETETAKTQQENPAKASEPATEEADQLISEKEFEALKNDPAQLRKSLQAAFTKKTMAVAEQRKTYEKYEGLISAWESNPEQVVTQLAKSIGFDVSKPATKVEAKEQAKTITDELREHLGDDLGFLADKLAPAMEKLIQRGVEQMMTKEIEPLKQQQHEQAVRAAESQTEAMMEAFTAKHSDWKQHEKEMVALGKKMVPGEGMDDMEYMESLYYLATKDVSEAEKAKKLATRMQESAAKSEESGSGVSGDKVAVSPTKLPSFREAFEHAKRGIRLE